MLIGSGKYVVALCYGASNGQIASGSTEYITFDQFIMVKPLLNTGDVSKRLTSDGSTRVGYFRELS